MTDELNSLVDARREAGALSRDSVKYYSWIVRGLIGLGFAAGIIWGRMEYTNKQQDERMNRIEAVQAERISLFKKYDAYIDSNNTVTLTVANSMNGIRDRVKSLEDWRIMIDPEHKEMWFMKNHGISNRDDFFQRHGYQAPEGPGNNTKQP